MNLNNEITELLNQHGCNIVGFADLRCLPSEARQDFDRAILIALSFTKEAMLENKNGSSQRYSVEHAPQSKKLKKLKELTADFLTNRGYDALLNTPSFVADDDNLRSLLPLKTIATLAGIGWIGKNAMLVTNKVGSALRMTAVLTNAPFDCGTPVTKSLCPPDCKICADVCPGNAPLGGLWEVGIERDNFFDAHACKKAAMARAKTMLNIEASRCGLCISSCQFTKRGLGYE